MTDLEELKGLLYHESTEQDAWAALLALPDLIARVERADAYRGAALETEHENGVLLLRIEGLAQALEIAEKKIEDTWNQSARIGRLEAALRELLSEGSIDERKRGFVEGLLAHAKDAD